MQATAKMSKIVEKYDVYQNNIQYGKQQTLNEIFRNRNWKIWSRSNRGAKRFGCREEILKHLNNLNAQERDAFLKAINDIQAGESQAIHPDSDAFMSTCVSYT